MEIKSLKELAIKELKSALDSVKDDQITELANEIVRAKRIFIYGLGRERLVLQAFTMRLMHLGLSVYMVGDVTTPRIKEGDLFITSSGTGYLSTVEALMKIAKNSQAKICFITAATDSQLFDYVHNILIIPVQTMKDNPSAQTSKQPMGTIFEQTQLVLFDLLVLFIKEKLGQTEKDMVDRHTNLE